MSSDDLNFIKARTKEAPLFSYWNYNNNVPQHLSKEEFLASQNLCKNKNIVIKILLQENQEITFKGNFVVVVYEAVYLDKMVNPLNDTQTFEKISLKNDKILNFAIKKEKHVDNILKKCCI